MCCHANALQPESGVLGEALYVVPGGGGEGAELQCEGGRGDLVRATGLYLHLQ